MTVSPRAKALHWFCLQLESSKVFPLFFISKEEEVAFQSLLLNETRGVFGIGCAAYFKYPSSSRSDDIKRPVYFLLMVPPLSFADELFIVSRFIRFT